MKNYDHIPQTINPLPKYEIPWAQYITIPKGWDYLRNYSSDYETAETELIATMDTEGDWVEIVNESENMRILYMIV